MKPIAEMETIPTKVDMGITKEFTEGAKPIMAKVDSALFKFNRIIKNSPCFLIAIIHTMKLQSHP